MAIIVEDFPAPRHNYRCSYWDVFCAIIFVFLFYRICVLETAITSQKTIIDALKTDSALMYNFLPYLNDKWCWVQNNYNSRCEHSVLAERIGFEKTLSGYKIIHNIIANNTFIEYRIIDIEYHHGNIILYTDKILYSGKKMSISITTVGAFMDRHQYNANDNAPSMTAMGKSWKRINFE